MVWTTKKRTPSSKKSVKNFMLDGTQVIKPSEIEPIEKRAVIYCRVSSNKQADDWWWLENQEEMGRNYCRKEWIIVDKVFYDKGVSWGKKEREAFNECVAYLGQMNKKFKRITHFVCRDLSRISRPDLDDIWAAFELEARIKQYGVIIVDIVWGTKDETDLDKLVKGVRYSIAWYQRKEIYDLCKWGRETRLKEWYWPFSEVPTGYKRTKVWWKTNYVDEINWPVASILKEWLELFANDPNMTQAELHKYFVSKWLKMYKSYIEKMFQLHRLYFYAWYIIYPERGIDTLIEWKHEWFISLETANKIKDKLQKKAPVIKRTKKEDDTFILKHMITCTWCGRKLTWWITRKSNWQEYHYYWCQREWCPERDNIPQDKLENQLFEMISQCQLPEPMKKLFDETLENVRWDTEKNWDKIVEWKKRRLEAIKNKKKDIQDSIMDTRMSEKLKESFYEQWDELDAEEEMIKEEISNDAVLRVHRNSSIQKIKELIRNPLIFWTNPLSDTNLRTKVLEVRFWNSLSYSKSEWIQTSDEPVLYNVLRDLSQKSTIIYQGWDSNPHDREVTRFWV